RKSSMAGRSPFRHASSKRCTKASTNSHFSSAGRLAGPSALAMDNLPPKPTRPLFLSYHAGGDGIVGVGKIKFFRLQFLVGDSVTGGGECDQVSIHMQLRARETI